MKILVFDDSAAHRRVAELTLTGHDLTIVGTYDEAQKALMPQGDGEKFESVKSRLLKEAGLPSDFHPWKNKEAPEADKDKYRAICKIASEETTAYPDFGAVLTDLLVPASSQAQGPEGKSFLGKEMPMGTTIALLALVAGVKNVAVVTDMNHHNHPASAAFDCFGIVGKCKIPGVNIICTNHVGRVSIDAETEQVVSEEFLWSEEGNKKYPHFEGGTRRDRKGLIQGKNWGEILKCLLEDETGDKEPNFRIFGG